MHSRAAGTAVDNPPPPATLVVPVDAGASAGTTFPATESVHLRSIDEVDRVGVSPSVGPRADAEVVLSPLWPQQQQQQQAAPLSPTALLLQARSSVDTIIDYVRSEAGDAITALGTPASPALLRAFTDAPVLAVGGEIVEGAWDADAWGAWPFADGQHEQVRFTTSTCTMQHACMRARARLLERAVAAVLSPPVQTHAALTCPAPAAPACPPGSRWASGMSVHTVFRGAAATDARAVRAAARLLERGVTSLPPTYEFVSAAPHPAEPACTVRDAHWPVATSSSSIMCGSPAQRWLQLWAPHALPPFSAPPLSVLQSRALADAPWRALHATAAVVSNDSVSADAWRLHVRVNVSLAWVVRVG
ncbi:hypothetical protein EON67_03840, partial [archaeon]